MGKCISDCLILAVVVIGGVKRISAIASMIVPFMVTVYLIAAIVIIVMNITAVPGLIKEVVTAAFARMQFSVEQSV